MNEKTEEEILLRRVDLARDRLFTVVDALDHKRHALTHPAELVKGQLATPVAIAAITTAGLAVGAIVAASVTKRHRARAVRAAAASLFWVQALIGVALFEVGKRAVRAIAPRTDATH